MEQPRIGSRVHYVYINKAHLASTVVRVIDPQTLDLQAEIPGEIGTLAINSVKYNTDYVIGTWHWPEETR